MDRPIIWLLDEPTPFSSKERWEEFLVSLNRILIKYGPNAQIEGNRKS